MANQKNVLIIDDETDLCKLITLILIREHFQVDCAFTLQEAENVLAHTSPPIVLLDNNLPDGDGIEFFQKQKPALKNTKVILITADEGQPSRQKALEAGIIYYLPKPFTLRKFLDVIKAVV